MTTQNEWHNYRKNERPTETKDYLVYLDDYSSNLDFEEKLGGGGRYEIVKFVVNDNEFRPRTTHVAHLAGLDLDKYVTIWSELPSPPK